MEVKNRLPSRKLTYPRWFSGIFENDQLLFLQVGYVSSLKGIPISESPPTNSMYIPLTISTTHESLLHHSWRLHHGSWQDFDEGLTGFPSKRVNGEGYKQWPIGFPWMVHFYGIHVDKYIPVTWILWVMFWEVWEKRGVITVIEL